MSASILDFGEVFRCRYDDDYVLAVVLRSAGSTVRFRLLARWDENATEEQRWCPVEDPSAQLDKILALPSSALGLPPLLLVKEQEAMELVRRGDVLEFREWWSGRKASRR